MNETILAIETSSETCSVALLHKSIISDRFSAVPRGHAKNLLPMIDELFAEAEIKTTDLDAIAVTNGPGAFTSIRIGVAVCQGLAAAVKCPVISISSLAVLAYGAMQMSGAESALVALDARMNEVYYGAYRLDETGYPIPIQADCVVAPDKLVVSDELLLLEPASAGIGWHAYPSAMAATFADVIHTPTQLDFPTAKDLLNIAVQQYREGKTHNISELLPVYLRDQVVHS